MLRLYDTRHRRTEPIVPPGARLMRMYTCGPAVHRRAHVGDLRSHLLSDLIRRVAERHRIRVIVCRSITDLGHPVDGSAIGPGGENGQDGQDTITARVRTEEGDARRIARFHEDAFLADTTALNIRPPEHSPRATEMIGPMIELIAKLVEKGHAYPTPDGSVLFDAVSFPAYGEISGNRLDRLRPGRRVRDAGPSKRFHADWALWGPSDHETAWESPWGRGFPGGHIACSAMSLSLLGENVDVHTGGIDLCFPHHENERAQSDSAAGHEVVRHWVHGERLLFDGREIPPSAGDVVLLADVTARGLDPLAVRLALMEHRHRRRMNLTWDALRTADRTLRHWRSRVAEWAESPSRPMPAEWISRIEAAFDDDLDTPLALRLLRELERDDTVAPGSRFEAFVHLDHVLGLDLPSEIGRPKVLPPGAAALLERRLRARGAGDWAASDRLRDELAALGVRVADTPQGQSWS
ncbi:cysteine--tRNA ligase [Streptosporangium violaceochromogenes]|nr:cysteine--tRNA ligase [Streptosporangium violaceochromogenes]